jgi:hypothetical protein
MDILTNDWWNWIFSTYTFSIGIASSFIVMILKCIAVLHPGEKANSIVGLLQGWIFGFQKWDGKDRRNSH